MPRRNPRKRLAERHELKNRAAGEDSDTMDGSPTSDVEMGDTLSVSSPGGASGASMTDGQVEHEQVHVEREVPDRKRARRRSQGARKKSPSPERDEDMDGQESGDEVIGVAKRAMTRKRRKQLDTPMQPRSRVRFGVGKNVIARIGRGWKVGWIVEIGSGKVCVRWHTGERRNKGMDDKWVKTTRVHVLSRAQMFALENENTTVEQLVKEIEEM